MFMPRQQCEEGENCPRIGSVICVWPLFYSTGLELLCVELNLEASDLSSL